MPPMIKAQAPDLGLSPLFDNPSGTIQMREYLEVVPQGALKPET